MRPFREVRWVGALVVIMGAAGSVDAAWDNVFQVCCFGCKSRSAVSYYAPAAACCPQPVCTTRYVQRAYYQPVTCYQNKTYYQPVTSYRTSYYYQPVTSYRYSCYYDPCTCRYQRVACPVTCYRLRSRTCAVTSYLQRTCQVPVTTYRLSYYCQPVTSCYTPSCCSPCSTPAAPAASVTPGVAEQATPTPASPAPGVREQRTTPAPPTNNAPNNGGYDRYYPKPSNPMPPAGSTNRRPPAKPSPPPKVRLDRIVSLPRDTSLGGQVERFDRSPHAGALVTFVSVHPRGPRHSVMTDAHGRFQVDLKSGGWLVYLTKDGRQVFQRKVEVKANDNVPVRLVSR